jgi:hypothetical protein
MKLSGESLFLTAAYTCRHQDKLLWTDHVRLNPGIEIQQPDNSGNHSKLPRTTRAPSPVNWTFYNYLHCKCLQLLF